ncbi:RNA polymerase II C-terminal domain phosphatase-like 4 [Panicum miliaceum]|uniref:RNA polymerase II C-terminal domain phosphatase-like n=1 Tax=Panicum miliaceum TaxID=4540 RepID=A0A3L6RSU0_PANMI|nr:RNA polymerase II C-terminal domain phosphatase-like 4 [Panicum miliaceum]
MAWGGCACDGSVSSRRRRPTNRLPDPHLLVRRPDGKTTIPRPPPQEQDQARGEQQRRRALPPHPGFVRGLCFRCGAKEEDAEGGAPRVAPCPPHRGLSFLGGVKDGGAEGGVVGEIQDQEGPAVPASATTSIPRASDLETLLRARKLNLILDLDHTLLNSTEIRELSPTEQSNGFTRHTRDDARTGLFRLDVCLLTKLRPFVRGFLEQASAMFEMYVYTLGGQEYARAVVKQLDPDGVYFGARIVSSEESTRRDMKNLDVFPGAEAVAVVILDDSDHVWPDHQENLILMNRYLYFASSCRQFGYDVNSLAELRRDEREHDGSLAAMLEVLKRVHQGFFDSVLDGSCSDVREVMKAVRREVLRGCTAAFSRVIPLEDFAGDHPMWKLTERLGAVCAANADATVTHVVAKDPGTEKARWARDNKFLVNPSWIMAASFRWCRPNEQEFPVTRGR